MHLVCYKHCLIDVLFISAVLVYKNDVGNTPIYIKNLLNVCENDHYDLRSAAKRNLTIPVYHTEYFKNSFSYTSVKTWNEIPARIKNIPSLQKFKTELNIFLSKH